MEDKGNSFLVPHYLMQKYPELSLYLVYTSQAGHFHPIIFAVDAFADLPRTQKNAWGDYSLN